MIIECIFQYHWVELIILVILIALIVRSLARKKRTAYIPPAQQIRYRTPDELKRALEKLVQEMIHDSCYDKDSLDREIHMTGKCVNPHVVFDSVRMKLIYTDYSRWVNKHHPEWGDNPAYEEQYNWADYAVCSDIKEHPVTDSMLQRYKGAILGQTFSDFCVDRNGSIYLRTENPRRT